MVSKQKFLLQPNFDRNEIFSAIRPQLKVDRRGRVYTPMHMRFHLLQFVNRNKESLTRLLKGPLEVRGITLSEYEQLMYNNETCGYEITVLLVAMMYMVPILVIRSDMLWVSENVMPADCPIVLVQNCEGQFLGTKSKYPVFVYDIPKIRLRQVRRNIKKVPVKHSTPQRAGNSAEFMEASMASMLSPIYDNKSGGEKETTTEFTDPSIEQMRREINSFESKPLPNSSENSMSSEYPEGKYNVMESSKTGESFGEKETTTESTSPKIEHTKDKSEQLLRMMLCDDGSGEKLASANPVNSVPSTTPVECVNQTGNDGKKKSNECHPNTDKEKFKTEQDEHSDATERTFVSREEEIVRCETETVTTQNFECDGELAESGSVNSELRKNNVVHDAAVENIDSEKGPDGTTTTAVFTDSAVTDNDMTIGEPFESPENTDLDKTLVASSQNSIGNCTEDMVVDGTKNADEVIEHNRRTEEMVEDKREEKPVTAKINEEDEDSDATIPMDEPDTTVNDGLSDPVNSDEETNSPKINITKKRLGMTGCISKFKNARLSMVDLKDELDEMEMNADISYVLESEEGTPKTTKVKQFCCSKCSTANWTLDGYETHLLQEHQIRDVKKYPPTVLTRTIGPKSTTSTSVEISQNDEEDNLENLENPVVSVNAYLKRGITEEDQKIIDEVANAEFNEATAYILLRTEYDREKKIRLIEEKLKEQDPNYKNYKPYKCSYCCERFFFPAGVQHHEASHRNQQEHHAELYTDTQNIDNKQRSEQDIGKSVNSDSKLSLQSDQVPPIKKIKVTAEIHKPAPVNSATTPRRGRKKRGKGKPWTRQKRSKANKVVAKISEEITQEDKEAIEDGEIGSKVLDRYKQRQKEKEEAMLESFKATYNL